jgi:hypothetical protein
MSFAMPFETMDPELLRPDCLSVVAPHWSRNPSGGRIVSDIEHHTAEKDIVPQSEQ